MKCAWQCLSHDDFSLLSFSLFPLLCLPFLPVLLPLCLLSFPLLSTPSIFLPSLPPLSDTLVAVLERDTLGVREVRLFVAAVRWAEAEAHRQQLQPTPENKRRVLGKALALIRFPLMTIEEFAAGSTHTHRETVSHFCTLYVSLTICLPQSDMFSYPCCVSTQDRPSPVS